MELGAFSISLNVKDLSDSKTFYEDLGFKVFGGAMEHDYLIMKNGDALIGLFQGMFEKNIITFNPGWDQNAQALDGFTNVRAIQEQLKKNNVLIDNPTDENATGPGSLMVTDPDGNPILIDQHIYIRHAVQSRFSRRLHRASSRGTTRDIEKITQDHQGQYP